MEDTQITYIGKVDHRNKLTKFGIKEKDRTKHMYVIGKTGTGKTTFIENMIIQDIQNGNGFAFIDPHGESADKILNYIPEWRVNDVIYLNPADVNFPVAFNPLEDMGPEKRHLIADGLMSVFEKIWPEAFSGRMTYILNNTMLALLESPDSTMLGVNRMLTDKDFRKKIVANVSDPAVRNAWDELMKWDDKRWSDAIGALVNKVGQFTTNPIIRNIIGQTKSTFDFRKAMDERKIIIINLSKGMIGEQNAPLIGAMLITKIYLAAMSRAELSPNVAKQAAPFYFYVDEFQNFANDSFANILSEARKYKLCLTVANQYIAQMDETIRDAVFGNMGTTAAFRVGPLDAEFMERVFAPVFNQEDLQNIAFGQYYVTLQIDGMGSKPFSAQGLGPIPPLEVSLREEVIAASRRQFARTRDEVEEAVMEWFSASRASVVKSETGHYSKQNTNQSTFTPKKDFSLSSPNAPVKTTTTFQQKTEQPKPSPVAEKKFEEKKIIQKESPVPEQEPEQPVVSSKTLQNLLEQLDESVTVAPVTTSVKELPKSLPEKKQQETPIVKQQIIKKVQPVPSPQKTITPAPQKLDRAASPEKKSALAEALAKAMGQKQSDPQPTPVAKKEIDKAVEQHIQQKQVHQQKQSDLQPQKKKEDVVLPPPPVQKTTLSQKLPREVPEDILRSVLE